MQDTSTVTVYVASIKLKEDETPLIPIQRDKNSIELEWDKISTVEIERELLLKRPKQDKPKLILVWKPIYKKFTKFDLEKCPVSNCETTLDRSKINESDVIVFSGRWPVQFPTYRPKGQIWIFQNREAQVGKILAILIAE